MLTMKPLFTICKDSLSPFVRSDYPKSQIFITVGLYHYYYKLLLPVVIQ